MGESFARIALQSRWLKAARQILGAHRAHKPHQAPRLEGATTILYRLPHQSGVDVVLLTRSAFVQLLHLIPAFSDIRNPDSILPWLPHWGNCSSTTPYPARCMEIQRADILRLCRSSHSFHTYSPTSPAARRRCASAAKWRCAGRAACFRSDR